MGDVEILTQKEKDEIIAQVERTRKSVEESLGHKLSDEWIETQKAILIESTINAKEYEAKQKYVMHNLSKNGASKVQSYTNSCWAMTVVILLNFYNTNLIDYGKNVDYDKSPTEGELDVPELKLIKYIAQKKISELNQNDPEYNNKVQKIINDRDKFTQILYKNEGLPDYEINNWFYNYCGLKRIVMPTTADGNFKALKKGPFITIELAKNNDGTTFRHAFIVHGFYYLNRKYNVKVFDQTGNGKFNDYFNVEEDENNTEDYVYVDNEYDNYSFHYSLKSLLALEQAAGVVYVYQYK